ncbi:MAG: hypothetical protein ACI4BI_06945 [Anaerotardibacter sp.]
MKKKLLSVIMCCVALCTMVVLVGCGSSNDGKTDCIWFKAELPKDCAVSSTSSPGTVTNITFEVDDQKIRVASESGTAEEEAAERIALSPDTYTAGDDVTIGKYTWKVVNFTWNGDPSVMLYTDLDGQKVKSAYVTGYCLDTDDEMLTSFLESIEFASDIDKAYEEAKNTKIDDFRTKNGLSK